MRAPVAAQGGCAPKLLPKSLNYISNGHQVVEVNLLSYVAIRPCSRSAVRIWPIVVLASASRVVPPVGAAIAAAREPTTLRPATISCEPLKVPISHAPPR